MRIGFFVSPQYRSEGELDGALEDLIGHVRAARDAGAASIWVPHHFITEPMRMFEPQALLARLSAEVDGLDMGTAILLLPMLNPVFVAEMGATLDWMTGGRFVLAVGQGYRPEEFAVAGVPFGERTGRMAESIALIRRLWLEDRVTFEGRYYKVEDIGLSMRPKNGRSCPIWVGGSVEPAVRRAARIGDAWITSFSQTRDELVSLATAFRAERNARDLPPVSELPSCRECYIGADDCSAFADCRDALLYKYEAYASWRSGDDARPLSETFDTFAREHFIIGDAERVADEIRRYRDEVGIDHLILRMHWPGLDPALTRASLRRLEGVIARL